jgi:DNA-binding MarR family transcriptional regulator
MRLIGITSSPAGALIDKLKAAGLVEPVIGQGKGKYKFVMPLEEN